MKTSTTTIKVRGFHLDLYGHVNNARYLEFLEEARWEHYEGSVDTKEFAENGWAFVIVNININYRFPAKLGDHVRIETQVKNAGARSVVIHQTAYLNDTDTVVADADVTFVILDSRSGKAINIEGRLRDIILA